MGLIFIPSTRIPQTVGDLQDAYWFAVWDRPIPVPHDLHPTGTVYLQDEVSGTILWETTVTDMVAVPYESSDMLRDYLSTRWGIPASGISGADPCPGFAIAWRADSVNQLELTVPEGLEPLEMWTSTFHIERDERERRGLRDEGPCPVC